MKNFVLTYSLIDILIIEKKHLIKGKHNTIIFTSIVQNKILEKTVLRRLSPCSIVPSKLIFLELGSESSC